MNETLVVFIFREDVNAPNARFLKVLMISFLFVKIYLSHRFDLQKRHNNILVILGIHMSKYREPNPLISKN